MRLIALEGIDGSGKTTLAKALAQELQVPYVFEPSNLTPVTKTLRELALKVDYSDEVDGLPREYIMAANRAITNKSTLKLLKYSNVVSDRSPLSGMVYAKASKLNMSFDEWFRIHASNLTNLAPSLIVHVTTTTPKIDPAKHGNRDIYDSETQEFFKNLSDTMIEGLEYFKTKLRIPYITFNNDFELEPEVNAMILRNEISKVLP